MFLELIANFMNGIFVLHGLDILHPFAKFLEYDSQVWNINLTMKLICFVPFFPFNYCVDGKGDKPNIILGKRTNDLQLFTL